MRDFKRTIKKYSDVDNKSYIITVVIVGMLIVIGVSTVNLVIDPLFHFRGPRDGLEYIISYEYYINDGIVRNFDYDAIITGTSMTENFKSSELDMLFGVKSIKVPFAGAYYAEVDGLVRQAVKKNNSLKMVVRGLDYNRLVDVEDVFGGQISGQTPDYLINDDVFDDAYYIINKEVFVDSIKDIFFTVMGGKTTSFDMYARWNDNYEYGFKAIEYDREEKVDTIESISNNDYNFIKRNLEDNVIAVARDNRDINFYYFITPYSILYFDDLKQKGQLEKNIALQEFAIKVILEANCENIKLFSFFDDFDLVTDLDNYKDIYHYGEDVNSYILNCMKEEKHLISKNNFYKYIAIIEKEYLDYDYDELFK